MATGLLLALHSVEAVLHILFARPAVAYLFDAGDAGLIIAFLVYGVYSILNAYAIEPVAGMQDVAATDQYGKIETGIRFVLRPAPSSFTFGSFAQRLTGHLSVYAVILVASIYLSLFVCAPLAVVIGSMGILLLIGLTSAAMFAPRGSPSTG